MSQAYQRLLEQKMLITWAITWGRKRFEALEILPEKPVVV